MMFSMWVSLFRSELAKPRCLASSSILVADLHSRLYLRIRMALIEGIMSSLVEFLAGNKSDSKHAPAGLLAC